MGESQDVRAIANFVIDLAHSKGLKLSNVSINKIVFFLHCDFLVMAGTKLVSAKSEAWTYGPVYRELYSQFKEFGDGPISSPATKVDPQSGEKVRCEHTLSKKILGFLEERANQYIQIAPFDLVNLSHVKGGPWDVVFNHEGETNPGMEIDNETIKKHYTGEIVQ